jgi:tRNA/tmRNA/rRNA uracil-C5-methylase (TrmA/RlmC/RlmD family)
VDADLLRVLIASPARIPPRCGLFGTCGGCQLQDLPYAEQLAWKTSIVRANFRRVGLDGAVTDCIASPREYGYRSKLTPHYEPARGDAPVAIGFLRQGRKHAVVDVPRCPIATDAINAELPALRATARAAASGRRRGASLIVRDATSGITSDPDARIRERVGAIELEFFAREFFQNNPFLLPTLVDFVVEHAVATQATVLVDTYSGSGLFALSAAPHFERVLGVEVSTVAVAAARANAARNQLTNVEFMAASAEHIFRDMTVAGESAVVVLDPPRKGADDRFLSQLIAFRPRALIYVSCNPETAARDIARLVEAGFLLSTVQPLDMFPQTRHVECVAVLTR